MQRHLPLQRGVPHWSGAFLSVVLLAALAVPAAANFTASGTFMFEDLPIDINGFQSPHPNVPCRLVDVSVIDNNTQAVLAQGATDMNGAFAINVVDAQVRNVAVLALSNSAQTSNLEHFVTEWNTTAIHAYQGIVVLNHDPNSNINMGTVVMHYRAGAEAFNLYDAALDGNDFIASLEGVRPPVPMRIRYTLDVSPNVAFYNGVVNMGGNFGYDDTILLHEMGHYIQHRYGGFSDNPGGSHFIGDSAQDPRLSFGEGWPTFWGSNVRDWRGINHPQVYLNSTGDSTTGIIAFSYDLETTQSGTGAGCEIAVQAHLWDMTDGNTTGDTTPGVDDEPGYQMDRTFLQHWQFTRTFLSQPPFVGDLTYEDFHELWIANVIPPQTFEMNEIEYLNHVIEYRADSWESDNNAGEAPQSHSFEDIGTGAITHHSTWPQGDQDWIRFNGLAGITYVCETLNMRDGADTFLEIRNSAQVVQASNDNVGVPVPGQNNAFEVLRSSASWAPPATQDVYVVVRRSSAGPWGPVSLFGNYNTKIRATQVPPTYPNMNATPASFNVILNQGEQTTRNLTIGNTGTVDPLIWNIVEPTALPWLTEAPASGNVPASQNQISVLTFNAAGMPVGVNFATLDIHSNDPDLVVKTINIIFRVNPGVGGVEEEGTPVAARSWLGANSPNPVNPRTAIRFSLREAGPAQLAIFDALGREISRPLDGLVGAGEHVVEWDGRSSDGTQVASGVYFYRLTSADFKATRKMAVVR
jgi:hypothetical protein